jgi:hypothetical protein
MERIKLTQEIMKWLGNTEMNRSVNSRVVERLLGSQAQIRHMEIQHLPEATENNHDNALKDIRSSFRD